MPTTVSSFISYYARQHWFLFIIMFLPSVIQAAYSSLSPYLIKLIIDLVVQDTTNSHDLESSIINTSMLMIGAFFLFGYSFTIRDIAFRKALPTIQKDIWLDLFSYLKHHSHNYFQKNFSGNLSEKVSLLVSGYRSTIELIEKFFIRILAIIIACILLYQSHPFYFIAIFTWSICFLLTTYWLAKKTRALSKGLSSCKNIVSGKLVDIISNILAIKVFSRIKHESSYMDSHLDEIMKKDKGLQLFSLKTRIIQTAMVLLLISVMLFLLVALHKQGLVTAGDFAFIIGVTLAISGMVNGLGHELVRFFELNGALSQALETINKTHEQKEAKNANPLQVPHGAIHFQNVVFTYGADSKEKQFSLDNIEIKSNEKIGIVGYSGSGKTTFINLILRLYDVNSGKILIDNQDISCVTLDSIYQNISLIPQEITLFNRSIKENIRYAKLSASDEDIIKAAKKAHIHEFIMSLDMQYDTEIGGEGIKLSTGQKQRIAIARAFLKDAPILILDEPTSALDAFTEQNIQLSLQGLMKNKTVIIIAHRLSTLVKMDRIFVFNNGAIDESAPHEKLLGISPLYKKLWESQSQGYISS